MGKRKLAANALIIVGEGNASALLQEVLTDGIQRSQIPLLQAHLQSLNNSTRAAALSVIVDHGLHKALEYLQRKEMKEAGQMLANLVGGIGMMEPHVSTHCCAFVFCLSFGFISGI